MNYPTNEMIEKLPKWAQAFIKSLARERDVSVRALNEFCDSQTKSKIYWDRYICTGESQGPSTKRLYAQSERIVVENAGVELRITCHEKDRIELTWSSSDRIGDYVAMIPESFQKVSLLSAGKMRAHKL